MKRFFAILLTLAVLCGKQLLVENADSSITCTLREVRDICVSAEGKVILVYSGKASYFDPAQYQEEAVS